jgi:hypothetical protein
VERQFGVGLAVGFLISGAAAILITVSQQLGIALIVVAIILGFLFVNPKSPVRKQWWLVSGKLGVVCINNRGFGNVGVGDKYLTIDIGLRAVSVIQVDKMVLKVGRKQLLSDWVSKRVEADEIQYINFIRPSWLCAGNYEAYLIAYTPDGISKSEEFPLIVDSQ